VEKSPQIQPPDDGVRGGGRGRMRQPPDYGLRWGRSRERRGQTASRSLEPESLSGLRNDSATGHIRVRVGYRLDCPPLTSNDDRATDTCGVCRARRLTADCIILKRRLYAAFPSRFSCEAAASPFAKGGGGRGAMMQGAV
jgi:hypothetical protein